MIGVDGSLRRRGKLYEGRLGLRARGNVGRRWLAHRSQVSEIAVDGSEITVTHIAEVEPRHGRPQFSARALQPLLFGESLSDQPEIGRVGGTPRTAPAELIPVSHSFSSTLPAETVYPGVWQSLQPVIWTR